MNDTYALIANFTESDIIVSIILYGTTHIGVKIPYKRDINELPFMFNIKGLIIDWRNREEHDLFEYVLKRYNGEGSVEDLLNEQDFYK